MPISLGSMTRRRFLTGSVAGVAAIALGEQCSLGVPDAQRDPDRMVLLSDIHIAMDPAKVERGMNMTQHLRQAVAEVLELEKSERRPAAAIVNGDCAHHTGETGDYEAMLGLLAPLSAAGLPIHLAMGNHDQRPRFWAAVPYEKLGNGVAKRGMESRQALVVRSPRVDWVILDTLDKTNNTPGLLGREQIQWLKAVLDAPERAAKPAIVMIHHDPIVAPVTRPTTGPASTQPAKITGLVDTPALLEVVMPRKQVKALVFGHTHVWSIKELNGLHLVNLPTVAYVFNPAQPSGWVDCRISDQGMRLELHCLDAGHPKHGDVADLRWRA
ncbi:MAG: metallophosphoesterase [Tepidisphaeraceae bacterium]|jgi:3',5'-cyclic AMP phosphodiesterase CpdA